MKKNLKTWLCSVLVVGATLAIGLFAGCTADDFKDKIDQTLCDHNYGVMSTETVKKATCTEEGEELWTCLKCGKEKTVVLEKIKHDFTDESGGWTRRTKEPTCHKEGEQQSRCGICKTVVTEAIPKEAHDEVPVAALLPTCTTAGYTEYSYCRVCNDFVTPKVTIPALGHNVEIIKGSEATCDSKGLTDGKKCTVSDCEEVLVEQKEIPALGHKIVYLEPIEATCEDTGLTAGYSCSRCDKVYVEQTETPLKEHKDNDGDFFCDDCFAVVGEEMGSRRELDLGTYLVYAPRDQRFNGYDILLNVINMISGTINDLYTEQPFVSSKFDGIENVITISVVGDYVKIVIKEGSYVDKIEGITYNVSDGDIGFDFLVAEGVKMYKVA